MNIKSIDELSFYKLVQIKKVIIFGASRMAQEAIRYFELKNQVVCLVDNDPQKWNTCFDVNGKEVFVNSPAILKEYNNENYILLIANRFYLEIIEQLNGMGFLNNLDCYVYPLMKGESLKDLKKNSKVKCSGCYACINICPQNCIDMQDDEEGFPYPRINKENCIQCGLCKKVCPVKNPIKTASTKDSWDIYAAWSLDDNIRMSSSSGGIFSELAMNVLKSGGYVCGVRFNDNLTAEHCIISDIKDLEQLRFSKYMQSNVGLTYKNIRDLLESGKFVMFSGTPCQAAALNKFLEKSYSNLLNCTFLCGGYNSPKVFHHYLNFIENKYGSKAKKVCLRDKRTGWYGVNFSVKIDFENGSEYCKRAKQDPFMNGFTSIALFCRQSCYDCKYVGINHPSDITFADFWGVKRSSPYLPTKKGVSLVVCHSEKGKAFFDKIKPRIYSERHSFEDALQLTMIKPIQLNFRRNLFMEQIDKVPFEKLVEQYLPEKRGNE